MNGSATAQIPEIKNYKIKPESAFLTFRLLTNMTIMHTENYI